MTNFRNVRLVKCIIARYDMDDKRRYLIILI